MNPYRVPKLGWMTALLLWPVRVTCLTEAAALIEFLFSGAVLLTYMNVCNQPESNMMNNS